MQMAKCNSNLSNHHASLLLWEPSYLHQMSEQLSSFNEIHQEKDSELILENVVHRHNKRMLNVVQNFFFKFERSEWIIFENHVFSDAFHCVNFLGSLVLNLKHFSERTLTNNSLKFEVLQSSWFSVLLDENSGGANSDTLLHFILTVWIFFLSVVAFICLYFKFIHMVILICEIQVLFSFLSLWLRGFFQ